MEGKMASYKQYQIQSYLIYQDKITLDQAVELIGQDIYTNKRKHVGMVLSRMVKNGTIRRIKNGVFELK
jgi:predicted transcriptional regulator of viral defense system